MIKVDKMEDYVEKIESVVRDEKYRGELNNVEGKYTYGLMVECTHRIWEVLNGGSKDVRDKTKVVDGYLIPYGENEWVRLIEDGYSYRGFVIYSKNQALRVILDQVVRRCQVSMMNVVVIQGSEGVRRRVEDTDGVMVVGAQ